MIDASEIDLIIDRMQVTRAANNVEWMALLRIAFKAEPEQTRAVIRRIAQYDSEIHDLWRQLGSGRADHL